MLKPAVTKNSKKKFGNFSWFFRDFGETLSGKYDPIIILDLFRLLLG